ncbi:thioredoxin domain-containing protein [Pseudomonas sp. LS-2]|uniref:DsbA family protein n=1 Tax=Pseudomonas sp. LS-2 TaxID=2315859 RepID=UPI000E70E3C1|nr:thioredoxin domain-containing protein [Pseudomonas sp. LS-2]RJX72622.1 hypothetical protein D3M70_30945 [Pseudomonas sp. LS-2]
MKLNPIAVLSICLATVTVVGGGALYLMGKKVETAIAVSDQANRALAKVKPWALQRDALDDVLDEHRLQTVIDGKESSSKPSPAPRSYPAEIDRRYGDPKSQFTLIEYSDFECPFCSQFFPVPKALADGSRGNISVVFKHVPIHGEASRKEAYAAECAAAQGGNDAFFRMAGAIFSSTQGNGTGTNQPLNVVANNIGLDGTELTKCMDEERFYNKIKADFKEAIDLGVKETPTTVVRYNPTNKQVVLNGAKTPEDILKAMGNLVKSSGASQ